MRTSRLNTKYIKTLPIKENINFKLWQKTFTVNWHIHPNGFKNIQKSIQTSHNGNFSYLQLLQMTSVMSPSLADTYSGYKIHTNTIVIIPQSQVLETETFRIMLHDNSEMQQWLFFRHICLQTVLLVPRIRSVEQVNL